MIYPTQITKSYDGAWSAESHIPIGETPEGTRTLELTTSKVRGGISACARVYIYKPDGSKETMLFGGFTKHNIAPTPCKRVTKKAVLEVHKRALLELPNTIEEAKAFYAKQDTDEQGAK